MNLHIYTAVTCSDRCSALEERAVSISHQAPQLTFHTHTHTHTASDTHTPAEREGREREKGGGRERGRERGENINTQMVSKALPV